MAQSLNDDIERKVRDGAANRMILNARFVTQQITGVQRAAYEIGRRLLASHDDLTALAPAPPRDEYLIPVRVHQPAPIALHGQVWEKIILRHAAARAPLTISLGGTAPIHVAARQLVMIHDVNYIDGPDAYRPRFRRLYTRMHRWLAHHASICTSSHYSARRLAECYGIDEARIPVVALGADHILDSPVDPRIIERNDLNARPFVLCVGSANPNKNFGGAIAGYAALDRPAFDLVIVGGFAQQVFADASSRPMPPGVRSLGFVTDGELRALYEAALGFLMPSFLEGFGIPVLEAMTLGCPVLAASNTSLPEVCGDAALYFDPHDPPAIAAAMARLSGDGALRADLRERGLRRAADFGWDRAADDIGRLMVAAAAGRDFATLDR